MTANTMAAKPTSYDMVAELLSVNNTINVATLVGALLFRPFDSIRLHSYLASSALGTSVGAPTRGRYRRFVTELTS